MAYVSLRGTEHYYEWITAQGDDGLDRATKSPPSQLGAKPVMLFIHGWGGSARYWQSTASQLSDGFDCLLYDLRGFGRSRCQGDQPNQPLGHSPSAPALAPFDIQCYADDIVALLDQFGLERVWLQSHSMGTSIAALFLAQHPQRVERAILTCAGIFEYRKPVFELFYFFGRYVVQFRPGWLAQIPFADWAFMQRFLHRPLAKALREDFLQDFLMADGAAALGTLQSAVSKQAAEEMPTYFSQLSMPTLLLSGEYDQIIPVRLGVSAAALNPEHIDHQVMPGTGHFPMLEDSPGYLQRVRTFLGLSPTEAAAPASSPPAGQDGNFASAGGETPAPTTLLNR
jgi:pimeloyl-ACP methyl ester carboxylesterase